jgi:dTDP-4-amino-4,6-dideoxygalactose transaminase
MGIMSKRIYLSSPHMGGNELAYIEEAFSTNWVAPKGPNIPLFENSLKAFSGASSAVAVISGTAAIHLALRLLGVERGDEVLCSTFTFVATINPVVYQNAIPILIESEKETWNMCPAALEEAIIDRLKKGKRPKAIIVVHLYGMPARMDRIMEIAERYAIPVIEDAAEALGSTYGRQHCGTIGDLGIYSFNGNKIITTSGGGALVSNSRNHIARAQFLATQAKDDEPYYQHPEVGYNYRMSNITAGIGCGQMEVLSERVTQRRANFNHYFDQLSDFDEVHFLQEPSGAYSNRWLTTISLHKNLGVGAAEDLRQYLESKNIESRPLWKPMHLQPIYIEAPYYGDGTSEDLFLSGLCLPSGSNLADSDLEYVISQIRNFLEKSVIRRKAV